MGRPGSMDVVSATALQAGRCALSSAAPLPPVPIPSTTPLRTAVLLVRVNNISLIYFKVLQVWS